MGLIARSRLNTFYAIFSIFLDKFNEFFRQATGATTMAWARFTGPASTVTMPKCAESDDDQIKKICIVDFHNYFLDNKKSNRKKVLELVIKYWNYIFYYYLN